MARPTKCPKCGCTQMVVGGQCKKCGAPLQDGSFSPPRVVPPPAAPRAPAGINPYAPPSAPLGGVGDRPADGVWQDGKIVVCSHNASFPDRCVKCNQPAGGYRLKRKLTWHPSGWYALILINILVYAIVARIIQKKALLHVGLCETHRKRRLWFMGLGLALPLLGAVGCSAAIENPNAIWIGMIGVISGIVLLIVGTSVLAAESIDERFARIRGAHRRFVESLPPFHR